MIERDEPNEDDPEADGEPEAEQTEEEPEADEEPARQEREGAEPEATDGDGGEPKAAGAGVEEAPAVDVTERVARLRDIDADIRRRDGELRSTKEAERATPAAGSGDGPANAPGERLTKALDEARRDGFKLAGRVAALESSMRETQRRNWEALQAQQESVKERLAELETAVGDAVEERLTGLEQDARAAAEQAAKGEWQAGDRFEKLSGRLETVEKLADRAELAEVIEKLSARVESLDGRLLDAERRAAQSEGLLGTIGAKKEKDRLELNEVTFEQLRELGLSVIQAARVIATREGLEGFSSTGQLDEIAGLPKEDLKALKGVVYVKSGSQS